ncbi:MULTISPECIES: ABC transporter ATP-binding protein [unclassified Streptococcus]|uniref:ABC transporter ATP-binding protein n=1 Tax=unclassified Streptococcus TaxID=2608887 RepID=UPI00107198D7|nr:MULTISPECIES: dipeptide/oligopeptide/nickel ABC transporter ATP-binding protein [unclassified Streptococcus]MBF0805553.1 ABC transporter ATP-binding protein [Streptococcus sp. 19428wA2_WM07]TFU28922.1 ABC transporter ATP-binding protein [Streptococcus sp. WM07]
MLECRLVSKSFQGYKVLENCQFSLQKGEIVGLMGPSGTGKTCLARILAGLETADQGQVLLDGQVYHRRENGSKIHLVFQDAFHALNPLMTVEEILQEVLVDKSFSQDMLIGILKKVGLAPNFLQKRAREMSGGQLQRICIARAILSKAQVIIFDESLSGLDPSIQRQLLALLFELKEERHLSYLFISHDFNLCQAICDRVLTLFGGKIIEEIRDFQIPISVSHPVTQTLIQKIGYPNYSNCRLKKAVMATMEENYEKHI